MFFAPLAVDYFADTFFPEAVPVAASPDGAPDQQGPRPETRRGSGRRSPPAAHRRVASTGYSHRWVHLIGLTSPFSAAFNTPLQTDPLVNEIGPDAPRKGNWSLVGGYAAFAIVFNAILLALMIWLFNVRWRVSG